MAIFLSNKVQGSNGVGALGFDAIEEWTVRETSKVSSDPVQDGSNLTDHYYQDPITADFSGVVTPWNLTQKGTDNTPEEFIRAVQNIKEQAIPQDVFLAEDLQPLTSCFITEFTYSRTAAEGDSIKISMSIKQVLKASKAAEVDLNDLNLAPDVEKQGQDSVDAGDTQTKNYTSAVKGTDSLIKVFTFNQKGIIE